MWVCAVAGGWHLLKLIHPEHGTCSCRLVHPLRKIITHLTRILIFFPHRRGIVGGLGCIFSLMSILVFVSSVDYSLLPCLPDRMLAFLALERYDLFFNP